MANIGIGASTGNPYTLAGGALSTLGSGSNLALPAMGYGNNVTQGIGGATSGLGGLLGVAGGVQGLISGNNPLAAIGSLGSGAYGAYQGFGSMLDSFGGGGGSLPSLTSAFASMAPEMASGLANALGANLAAGASAEAISAALSAGLGTAAGAAAPIIQAITGWLEESEAMKARESGWWNNPIKGELYSGATSGVADATSRFQAVSGGQGGLQGAPTDALVAALGGGMNSLIPYYQTKQGGVGAIRASDTVTGTLGQSGYTGDGMSPEKYTQNFADAQQGMVGIVQELLNRGMTYEQLGKLPISGDWVQQGLDANQDYVNQSYQRDAGKYDTDLYNLRNQAGDTRSYTPAQYLESVQGAAMYSPEAQSHASNLITNMYGGPLWTALARMGTGGQGIQDLIQQHFDPWWLPKSQPGNFGGFTYGSPVESQMLAGSNVPQYLLGAPAAPPPGVSVEQLMLEQARGSQGGA